MTNYARVARMARVAYAAHAREIGEVARRLTHQAAVLIAASILDERPDAVSLTIDWSDQGGDNLTLSEVIFEDGSSMDAWDLECIDTLPYTDLTHGWHDDLTVYDWSPHLDDMTLDLRAIVKELS